jgi:hypothetical protein
MANTTVAILVHDCVCFCAAAFGLHSARFNPCSSSCCRSRLGSGAQRPHSWSYRNDCHARARALCLKQKHEPQLFPTDLFSNPIVLDWSFLVPNSSPLIFPPTQFFPTDFSSNPILPDWSYLQPNSSQLIFPPTQFFPTEYSSNPILPDWLEHQIQCRFSFPIHTKMESKNTGQKNNWKNISRTYNSSQPASQQPFCCCCYSIYQLPKIT